MTAKPFSLRLSPNTQYDECTKYDNGIPGDCPNTKSELLNQYAGEIEYNNYRYFFYSPNKLNCSSQQDLKGCKLKLELSKDTVDNLASQNIPLKDYLKKLDSNMAEIIDPDKVLPKVPTDQIDEFQQNLITYGLPVLGAIIILIIVYTIATKGFGIGLPGGNSRTTNKKQRSKSVQSQSRDSISLASTSNFNASDATAFQNLNIKLSSIITTIKSISSRVDSLETEVCALNQKNQVVVSTSKSITLNERSNEMNFDTTQLIAKTMSVDLLKEAVVTNNYDLIRDFPHFFLSETQESQQGLTNSKRFILEGDQSQAGSRTQSEFIAINCNDETYLIPNILPNATNPERTLKRHADRNNIYRNGQGTNLLKLEELAVIQRNGDYFDLKSIGQIS